ncbi:MAG: sugar phosphate isomerase/epimerase [Propionibacteriaceae bacterium]|nr:sugar phosphate isomerase/epimerase [Propionibacteriaceae bacterium]
MFQKARQPVIGLSTSSVYPESTGAAFEYARKLGFGGVEVMVGVDKDSADVDALRRISEYHELPVIAIHAPCLLATATVWGTDPWEKLKTALDAAERLGASTVVVHPPFRWQGSYATGFLEGVNELQSALDAQQKPLAIAVENMYPWRGPLGLETRAYEPHWDPTNFDCAHLALDLSHASTAKQSSLELVRLWGSRLRHVHLTDGSGQHTDEHLLPGTGDQRADAVLAAIAQNGFDGDVVLEVQMRTASSRAERERLLAESLAFAREHLRMEHDDWRTHRA